MSGYGLDSEGRRIVSDPDLVGSVGSDGLGLIYQPWKYLTIIE